MSDELLIVGMDGSERSHDALRFALEEARLRNATVEVITWHRRQLTVTPSSQVVKP